MATCLFGKLIDSVTYSLPIPSPDKILTKQTCTKYIFFAKNTENTIDTDLTSHREKKYTGHLIASMGSIKMLSLHGCVLLVFNRTTKNNYLVFHSYFLVVKET